MKEFPKCKDKRKCFAKVNGKCICLDTTYEETGDCPFCKQVMEVTNGKYYALNRNYTKLA